MLCLIIVISALTDYVHQDAKKPEPPTSIETASGSLEQRKSPQRVGPLLVLPNNNTQCLESTSNALLSPSGLVSSYDIFLFVALVAPAQFNIAALPAAAAAAAAAVTTCSCLNFGSFLSASPVRLGACTPKCSTFQSFPAHSTPVHSSETPSPKKNDSGDSPNTSFSAKKSPLAPSSTTKSTDSSIVECSSFAQTPRSLAPPLNAIANTNRFAERDELISQNQAVHQLSAAQSTIISGTTTAFTDCFPSRSVAPAAPARLLSSNSLLHSKTTVSVCTTSAEKDVIPSRSLPSVRRRMNSCNQLPFLPTLKQV